MATNNRTPRIVIRLYQCCLLSCIRLYIRMAAASVSSMLPLLSITKWDFSHFVSNGIWESMRLRASGSESSLRANSLCSCLSESLKLKFVCVFIIWYTYILITYQDTVTILCIKSIRIPVSKRSGKSSTIQEWPDMKCLKTRQKIVRCIVGCVIWLSFPRFSLSSNIIRPRAARFISLLGSKTSSPKIARIFCQHGWPGSTTAGVSRIVKLCLGTLIELNYNIPEKCRIDLLTLPGYFICINYWNAVALKDFGYCTFTCGDTTSYCHNEHL